MVKTNKQPRHKQATDKKINKHKYIYILGVLIFIFASLVVGRYIYDYTRFNNADKLIRKVTDSLQNKASADGLSMSISYENNLCYRNVNKYDYKLKETCEHQVKFKINNNHDSNRLYPDVISKLIKLLNNIDLKRNTINDISEDKFLTYVNEISVAQSTTPSSLIIYSVNINSPASTTCSIDVRYDGLEQSKSISKLPDEEYVNVLISCYGDVIFSPYRVENV